MKSEIGFDGFVDLPLPNQQLLRRLFGIQKELTIFDIGSCEGEDSVRYARYFPNSKVHAFEPIPDNFSIIKKNVQKYGLGSRITVNKVALSDKNGKAEIHVSSGQPKNAQKEEDWDYGNKSSSLLQPEKIAEVTPWLSFKKKITVTTQTLDSYCQDNDVKSIDFIHMDVQGAELMVLNGAKKLMRNVSAIWLEVENVELYKGQPLKRDIEKFMESHNFERLVDTVDGIAGDQLYVAKSYLSELQQRIFTDTTLSVIIPTYNRADKIKNAIDSALTQSRYVKSLEVIVIDDGSTDETEELIKKIYTNSNVRYHKIKHSGQPAIARNIGSSHASGDLLAFLDSDDVWLSNKLQDQLPFFEDESTVLVYGQGQVLETGAELVNPSLIASGEDFSSLLDTNSVPNSSVIVRKNAFNTVGGFSDDKNLEVEDYHLWLKLALMYPKGLKYCGTSVIGYASTGSRMSDVAETRAAKRILYVHELIRHHEGLSSSQISDIDAQIIADHRHIKHLLQKDTNPLISVVMSVYNGELYLRKAIDSILSQTFGDFEFIIINDGSSDGTAAILDTYTDPRIYVVNQQNKGLVTSLNTGCKIAVGTYIARMDADDISMPSRFEKEIALFATNPALTLVGTFFSYINEAGIPSGTTMASPTLDIDLKRALYTVNPFAHGSTMFKREAWEQLTGYVSTYGPTEDYELWRRFADNPDYTFSVVAEPLYLYRLNPEGISNTKSATQAKFTQLIASEQWAKPYIGKGVKAIIRDGKYYQNLHPTLSDQIFNSYYYQNLHIMQYLFLNNHFLTGVKQAGALFALKPRWSRNLIIRSICGGFLRKIGVKK